MKKPGVTITTMHFTVSAPPSPEAQLTLLREARAYVADKRRWCKRTMSKRSRLPWRPARACGLGAVLLVPLVDDATGDTMPVRLMAQSRLNAMSNRLYGWNMGQVNDVLGHAEMLRVYDYAIAALAEHQADQREAGLHFGDPTIHINGETFCGTSVTYA